MSNNSFNINETTRRYAKALLLCVEPSDKKLVNSNFTEFISLYKKTDTLRVFFQSPLVGPKKRLEILEKILLKMNFCLTFSNFFNTLAKNSKLFLIEKIYDEYIKLLDFNDGITEVTVTTTKALNKKRDDQSQEMIKSKIGKHLNSKIKLKKIIDSEIIGGIIITIDSIMIDNSIRQKLSDFNFNERPI